MKKSILITLSLCFLLVGNIYSQKNLEKGIKQITPELLKQYIDYLASDSMKGRNTPSPELNRAADYIANEFEAFGIKKVNGTYFQNIPFCTQNLDVNNCLLKISLGDNSKSFNLKTDYTPFEETANGGVASPIVFAGYGITAPEYNYDDYKDIDVKGKIVLIIKSEPGKKDPESTFLGDRDTKHSYQSVKFKNAIDHGAIGVLLVTDPLNHIRLAPQGYPWPGLSKFLPQDNLAMKICDNKNSIPLVQIGESVIKYLFGSVDSLKNIQLRIDQNNAPQSFLLTNSNCQLTTALTVNDYVAKNVVGYIEGKDATLKNEFVVIGGHYDHLGYSKNLKVDEDSIFNGADDNASGTAGVMATAKAFASMKAKPKRSIVFMLFAGEELGLYGSSYYCNNPLFPLDKTVAMLNLDMISRNGADTLQIDGLKFNPDLAEILFKEADKLGLRNIPSNEGMFGSSDHANFFKNDISALNITSGLHKDYHKVTDDITTYDPQKAATISKLIFNTAWIIANQKEYLKINKETE